MSNGDMLQIHMLTAYPATLLNRDDAGLAKRISFGGAMRIRVSSQCLKKHWREAPDVAAVGPQADRSTRIYEDRVAGPLMKDDGASRDEAETIARYLMAHTVDTKPDPKAEKEGRIASGQLLVLTRAETDFLRDLGREILETVRQAGGDPADEEDLQKHFPLKGRKSEFGKRLKELPASIDTAMFGRMVTSDLFSRVDSAVSVAHAFTTHAEESEVDYFTAVDTLKTADDDAGAGLIQEMELTTGVFYLYAVVDMNQLRDNLGAESGSADKLVQNLIRTMATVSPGAKRGSTAPFSYAEFVLLERGDAQPRSLANAFLEPVRADGASLMKASVESLMRHRARLTTMYGDSDLLTAVSSVHVVEGAEAVPLDDAITEMFAGGLAS